MCLVTFFRRTVSGYFDLHHDANETLSSAVGGGYYLPR